MEWRWCRNPVFRIRKPRPGVWGPSFSRPLLGHFYLVCCQLGSLICWGTWYTRIKAVVNWSPELKHLAPCHSLSARSRSKKPWTEAVHSLHIASTRAHSWQKHIVHFIHPFFSHPRSIYRLAVVVLRTIPLRRLAIKRFPGKHMYLLWLAMPFLLAKIDYVWLAYEPHSCELTYVSLFIPSIQQPR